MTVGNRIREVRTDRLLGVKDIAQMIGSSKSRALMIEIELEKPTREEINLLAKALKLNARWILTGKGDPNTEESLCSDDFVNTSDLKSEDKQVYKWEIAVLEYLQEMRVCAEAAVRYSSQNAEGKIPRTGHTKSYGMAIRKREIYNDLIAMVKKDKSRDEKRCAKCFYLAHGKKAALLEERILRIETIADRSLEELEDLLLKGYTLQPPEPADIKQLERQIKEKRRKSLWGKLLTSFKGVET